MQTQARISATKLAAKIGSLQSVLVDEIRDDTVVARSYADAPEIDGLVFVPRRETIKSGDILQVRINNSDDYDLYGEEVPLM